MLSAQNLSYLGYEQNRARFFEVLANTLHDGTDRFGLQLVLLIAACGWVARLAIGPSKGAREGALARWRLAALGALALVLYFTLPFDIRGYMYYLNTRFAHLAAALLVAAVPPLAKKVRPLLIGLGTTAVAFLAITLARGFAEFNREAAPLVSLAKELPDRPRVMGLIFDPSSTVVTHPVFLHAATVLARLKGGITNFSFASTPHSPLRYSVEPLPTFPSEWNPSQFRWDTMGEAYDAFLIRPPHGFQGHPDEALFGQLMGQKLSLAGKEGTFWLVRRR
jgi:hypothetical protein